GDRYQWAVGDVNNDVWQDLIQTGYLSGDVPFTRVWLDLGGDWDVPFDAQWPVSGTPTVIDVDHNGQKDIVVLGEHADGAEGLWWMLETDQGWAMVDLDSTLDQQDTIHGIPQQVWFQDLDKDGWEEVVVLGDLEGTLVWYSFSWDLEKKEYKDSLLTLPSVGLAGVAWGDYNHDGYVDLYWQGDAPNLEGNRTALYLNNQGVLGEVTLVDFRPQELESLHAYLADLDGDGTTDLITSGYVGDSAITLVYYQKPNGATDGFGDTLGQVLLPNGFALGHWDDQGQLEWLGDSIRTDSLREKNVGPGVNPDFSVNTFFGVTTFSWGQAEDDRTPPAGVTFDMRIWDNDGFWIAGDFGGDGGRMVSGPGRVGYATQYPVADLDGGKYYWVMQPIDNAFWSYRCSIGEMCDGAGPLCFELAEGVETVCKGDTVTLTSPFAGATLEWLDSDEQVLGTGSSISFVAHEPGWYLGTGEDAEGCIVNYSVEVKIEPIPESGFLGPDQTVCVGELATLLLPDTLTGVWYEDDVQISQAATNTHSLVRTQVETVVVRVEGQTPEAACPFKDTVEVNFTKPDITMPSDEVIWAGESTRLQAEGQGVFVWSPAETLSDTTGSAPSAAPKTTTIYTATLTDSLGCTTSGQVEVQVKGPLFVPELFTPNGDGANDRFLIFGTGIESAAVQIFDRDGRVVFASEDVGELIGQGWDGTYQGALLPPDTYTWVLRGAYIDGDELTYEGKTTGVVRIIR
ncbi:MAG TPA: hypothetical protein DCP28_02135, partial [Cytophagales bacterium]|nr:hypothetical protein [Cytophagales bacterium]